MWHRIDDPDNPPPKDRAKRERPAHVSGTGLPSGNHSGAGPVIILP